MSRVLVRYNVQIPFHEETITWEQYGGKGAQGITTASKVIAYAFFVQSPWYVRSLL